MTSVVYICEILDLIQSYKTIRNTTVTPWQSVDDIDMISVRYTPAYI